MSCDLCGGGGPTALARIEGTTYRACAACAEYGEVIPEKASRPKRSGGGHRAEDRVVAADAGRRIRKARERQGKQQQEFAQALGVKASELQHWESGQRQPTVAEAAQIAKRLGIELLEEDAGPRSTPKSYTSSSHDSGSGMTIGDMLKKR